MTKTPALAAALAASLILIGNPAAGAPMPVPAPDGHPAIWPGPAIIVSGRGVAEAAPDRAIVTIGTQVTRPTAREAQEQTGATMTQVLRQVTALGIPRERIQTVGISLYPQRRPSGDISGYQAVQRAAVTVDDLALAGRVLDVAVAAGANLLDGVSFTLRDPAAARARAFAAAMQDARATANALAAAGGVSISRIVRIEEMGAAIPIVRGPALQAAPEVSTPVLPGTLSVSVEIRAVFAF